MYPLVIATFGSFLLGCVVGAVALWYHRCAANRPGGPSERDMLPPPQPQPAVVAAEGNVIPLSERRRAA